MDKQERLETKYYKLEKLCKWEHVDEVNEMLMNGVSPHKVSAWCRERGFDISHPKLYEYKDLLKQAIAKQVTVERLLGIGVPKRSPIVLQALGVTAAKDMVKTELEVLDMVIQRGYSQLLASPDIDVKDAMKAIELKNKLTGGAHGGLTGFGLDQIREIERLKFEAIVKIVLEYVPVERHEELQEAIAEAEHQFYTEQAPELLEQYELAVQAELDAARDTIDTIVSDKGYQG